MDANIMTLNLIPKIETYVKAEMAGNDSSHDWFHIDRVRNMTLRLAKCSNLSEHEIELSEISALLHDIKDWKYSNSSLPCTKGKWDAPIEIELILRKNQMQEDDIDIVCYVVANVGFSKEIDNTKNVVPDIYNRILHVVQDADRLDALGAIGIARCLTYGGAKGNILYDPALPPRKDLSATEYKLGKSTTMNHFYEKLFKLKDMMKTQMGQEIAKFRHEIMVNYVNQFCHEIG